MPKKNEDRTCRICGSPKYYAKGLCRACYNRQLRYGMELPPHEELVRMKYLGTKANGWTVVDYLGNSRVVVQCDHCKAKKVVLATHIMQAREHKCWLKNSTPKTEAQARVYKTMLKNKYDTAATAAELGISRQALQQTLKRLRETVR